jgi:hypothetical protein
MYQVGVLELQICKRIYQDRREGENKDLLGCHQKERKWRTARPKITVLLLH